MLFKSIIEFTGCFDCRVIYKLGIVGVSPTHHFYGFPALLCHEVAQTGKVLRIIVYDLLSFLRKLLSFVFSNLIRIYVNLVLVKS